MSEKYDIPIEALEVRSEMQIHFDTLEKTYQLVTIIAWPKEKAEKYTVLFDIATGEISEDLLALQEAERQARLAKYGKLAPELYERVQRAEDEDVFPVAIWAAGQNKQPSKQELYEILAARWPEAAEAMRQGRKPMQVSDRELAREIYRTYLMLLAEDIEKRVAPVLQQLASYGIEAEHREGEPIVYATVSKEILSQIANHPAVDYIFYHETRVRPETEGPVSTVEAPETD
ncbi:MAG: hypothetical protein GXP42_02025 [Chloroflexi bacterium]|nr:hypothetical protein [Chloroflexota bacterium]